MGKQRLIEAGRIVNTHGIAGEVKIEVWLDSPEFMKRFKRLFIGEREIKIESARIHKGFVIAKLAGADDINAAMPYKGKTVHIAREDARLPEGGYFLQDIIGARVVSEDGAELGTLTDIIESPAHNIYVVTGEREHLIPAVPEFIRHTDADEGIVTVHLIEGL